MVQFRNGFYADIRVEDRSRTVISYKAGVLEEMRTREERQAFLRVYDGRLWYYASVTDVDHLQKTLDGLYAAAEENPHILEDPVVRRFERNRDEINTRMTAVLDEATDQWGLKVTRVEVKNITPPKEIEEVMTKQMRAERERRQVVLEAQAHQESVVARAEGDKKAKVLAAEAERDAKIALAEGEARYIEQVYQAEADGIRMLKEAGSDESILRYKGIDALKDVADGKATKIYMPSDIASVVTSLGVAGEALGISGSASSAEDPRDSTEDPCIDHHHSPVSKEAASTNQNIERSVSEAAEH